MAAADETRAHRLDSEEALAIRPDRGVLVHARVAHWTLALRAVRATPASVARAGAVGAPAMRAAPTRAREEGAAEGKAGAPRGARARAIVAHLVLPAAADAPSLGAVGPTPPVVAQASVCRASPMPRAARCAVGNLTEKPIEAVGAVAGAIDAHAVQPAAGRRARTRRAVVATPALFALAPAEDYRSPSTGRGRCSRQGTRAPSSRRRHSPAHTCTCHSRRIGHARSSRVRMRAARRRRPASRPRTGTCR